MKINLNTLFNDIMKLNKNVEFETHDNVIKVEGSLDSLVLPERVRIYNNMLLIDDFKVGYIFEKASLKNNETEDIESMVNNIENEKKKAKKKAKKKDKSKNKKTSAVLFNLKEKLFSSSKKKRDIIESNEQYLKQLASNDYYEVDEELINSNSKKPDFHESSANINIEEISKEDAKEETLNTKATNTGNVTFANINIEEVTEPKKEEQPKEIIKEESIKEEPTENINKEEIIAVPNFIMKNDTSNIESNKIEKKKSNNIFEFKSVSQVNNKLEKIDKYDSHNYIKIAQITDKIRETESKIEYYETFLSTHDLSHKDDEKFLNNMNNKLINLKNELVTLKELEKKYYKKIEESKKINSDDDIKMKYYTQTAIQIDERVNKLVNYMNELKEESSKIIPVWNKELYRYDEGNKELLEDRIRTISNKIEELLILKEELLCRKALLNIKFNDQTKIMSDAWYSVSMKR